MLQVARLAPKLLGESADLVRDFLLRQQNPDGGFKDRLGKSDLYYTVFGMDGLWALEASSVKPRSPGPAPESSPALQCANEYLRLFRSGESLDFVHLCCLARCLAALPNLEPVEAGAPDLTGAILCRIEDFRVKDGGYSPDPGRSSGTAYAAFLALGAYQDLKAELPEPMRLVQSLKFLETPDGAWANDRRVKIGSTNATAAAVTTLRNLGVPVNQAAGDWLLARCHSQGGFLAAASAPIPDLLSTATALHALAGLEVQFGHLKEKSIDFIDTLWTNEGGFHGQWADDHLDCEYTYYGLLALGHLSL
jgi:prenyltransferase beta subunit